MNNLTKLDELLKLITYHNLKADKISRRQTKEGLSNGTNNKPKALYNGKR